MAASVVPLLMVLGCAGGADDAAGVEGTFVTLAATVDGYARSALLYEPAGLPDAPVPLVVVLHGLGGSGASAAGSTGFSAVADAEGILVAYPSGIDERWHDGSLPILSGEPDDVAYLRALLDHIDARHPIDRTRVLVTGFSNGAGMSVRVACDAPELVAAVAPVGGGTVGATLDECAPTEPVPVMHVGGTDDSVIPYEAGEGGLGDLRVPSIGADALAAFWAEADACAAEPDAPTELAVVPSPDGTTTARDWTDCAGGAELRFVRVDGGRHEWPRGSATAIWDWFTDLPALGGD